MNKIIKMKLVFIAISLTIFSVDSNANTANSTSHLVGKKVCYWTGGLVPRILYKGVILDERKNDIAVKILSKVPVTAMEHSDIRWQRDIPKPAWYSKRDWQYCSF